MEIDSKVCPSCGKKNNPGFGVCWKCGIDFATGKMSTQTVQATTISRSAAFWQGFVLGGICAASSCVFPALSQMGLGSQEPLVKYYFVLAPILTGILLFNFGIRARRKTVLLGACFGGVMGVFLGVYVFPGFHL